MKWVKARSECTTEVLFALLAEQVASDVDARKELKTDAVEWTCERQHERIVVARSVAGQYTGSVVFRCSKVAITAEYVEYNARRTTLFTATPNLLDSGTCKMDIDGTPVETWRVSQRALDRLFFEI